MKACFQSHPTSDLPSPEGRGQTRGSKFLNLLHSLFVVGAFRQLPKFSRCGRPCKPQPERLARRYPTQLNLAVSWPWGFDVLRAITGVADLHFDAQFG